MNFLKNYLPPKVVSAVPGLPFRNAVVVGKAVAGSVPLMFEVPRLEVDEPLQAAD